MNRDIDNQQNQYMEFEALPIQSVMLEQKQVEQAVEISDRTVTEACQWKTYLNALALFGFQDWFTENAPDLLLDWRQCSLLKPHYANVIEAAFGLRVNDFKLCLIATGGAIDSVIKFPRAVMDLAEFQSHFYIVVRVLEEQGQAQVQSFLRYDQWAEQQRSQPIAAEPDWSYRIPAAWFDTNLNRLLLHLHCLETQAIALPAASPLFSQSIPEKQHWLAQQFAPARSVETPLWQLLSWQEGVHVLTNPTLLEWLYQVQTGQIPLHQVQPEASQSLLQPILKAKEWLQDELDDMAQALGWILLPPFAELRGQPPAPTDNLEPAPVTLVRQELDLIRKQLSRQGTPIPSSTRCVYRDLTLAQLPLRLYAMTWLLPAASDQPAEWVLLLIVKTLSEDSTEPAVTLSIKDAANLLAEHTLTTKTDNNFIYAHVIGTLDEAFSATLSLDTGETTTLPLFAFHSGE